VNNLPRVVTQQRKAVDRTRNLLIASQTPYRYASTSPSIHKPTHIMCCTHIDMTQACSTNLLMITTDAETTATCCSSDLRVLRCRIERVGYVNVGGVSAMLVLSRRKCALRHGGAMLCIRAFRGTSHGPVSVCVRLSVRPSVCHKSEFY